MREARWRLFIATEIPAAARQAIDDIQRRLGQGNLPVRWERPDKLHVTLLFLGATDPARVPSIVAALRGAAATQSAHELHLGSPGAFPSLARPSSLWVGVAGAVEALARLQVSIVSALEPLGIARESRPFHPHVTIGRVRRDATHAERHEIGRAIARLPSYVAPTELRSAAARPTDVRSALRTDWTVERVVLFQSVAERETTRYVTLGAVDLPRET